MLYIIKEQLVTENYWIESIVAVQNHEYRTRCPCSLYWLRDWGKKHFEQSTAMSWVDDLLVKWVRI